jgi:hypothetical protein
LDCHTVVGHIVCADDGTTKYEMQSSLLTNSCRQRGMAGPVPLRGSRHLVPRA